MTRRHWLLLAALLIPGAAHADPSAALAGLFMQSCLPYAGDPAGLRAWAAGKGLPKVPEQARKAFLLGAPGDVFDASDNEGKFVVASSDDGICSTATNKVTGPAITEALESDLRASGIAFRLVIERDDKTIPDIHDREYLATKNGRNWRILLATVKDRSGGQAMITGAPSS
ncbi:MAG: NMCC_0638 family (lipo)protein [Rhodopila sp.]